jgi:hypothetical protein
MIFAKPLRLLSCCILALGARGLAHAQTVPAAESTSPSTNLANWTWKGIQLAGSVDAYYSLNFNHPVDHRDQLRNFDLYANDPNLSYAKFSLSRAAEPVGFQIDAGGGPMFNWFHSFDPNRDYKFFHHILQAYISIKPKSWHGVQIDGGKFYTSAGAEVTETQLNWNYTRSLLFALGPYYHVGVRGAVPVGQHLKVGAAMVNGWNNLVDNNTGKTLGLTSSLSVGKVTWSNAYYGGPEHTDTNRGWRHFYDTVLTVTPTSKTSLYVNFDYGTDRPAAVGTPAVFYGIASAVQFRLSERFAVTPRVEWYNDRDGWATGAPQKLKEYTLTGECKLHEGLIARLEWRQDFSNIPYFHRGNDQLVKSQPTLVLGMVAFFGPKQ